MTPTTKVGRPDRWPCACPDCEWCRIGTLIERVAYLRRDWSSSVAAIERAAAQQERERFMHYIQHEPDCALRTPEGDCVCGLAAILAEPTDG